jgi:hypothetical protein
MAGYGWSYLTVVHDQGARGGVAPFTAVEGASTAPAAPFRASDDSSFVSESEMFRDLGVTGWELVTLRESQGRLVYYFKRPRA